MTDVATIAAPRLPIPPGVDAGQWRVLTEAIFPNAKSADSIVLALNYCKVRGLDIMKRPVNIVPIWSSALGREVETVWPSINEIEVTAARTKEWAGMDEPKWGNEVTETFHGRRKDRQKGWIDVDVEVTYPEWCAVTVYRMVNGTRCPFTEPVYWREAYGRVGRSELPNEMWQKRPYGQVHKVAKAASLRAAFPEEGDLSAEEMEGQTTAEALPPPAPLPADNWSPPNEQSAPDHDPETGEVGPREIERGAQEPWRDWCTRLLVFVRAETELEPIEAWVKANRKNIEALSKDAPKLQTQLEAAVGRHRVSITQRHEQELEHEHEQSTDLEQEQRDLE
jgi:phage recombination protein Bet